MEQEQNQFVEEQDEDDIIPNPVINEEIGNFYASSLYNFVELTE